MTNSENCDAKTLAVIAVQFIAKGDDEDEALKKSERSLSQGDCLREKVRGTITGRKGI